LSAGAVTLKALISGEAVSPGVSSGGGLVLVVCGFLLVSNKGNNAFVIVAWTAAVSQPECFCDVLCDEL